MEHKWRYRQHCVRSDNRLSCRGFGDGGCADTRVSPCLWLAHRKYIGCCPLRDVVRTFRYGRTSCMYLLLVVIWITCLLTNVNLLSYVLIYLHANVFDPVFIYFLLSTILRLFIFFTLFHHDSLFRTLFPSVSLHLHTSFTMSLNWTSTHKKERVRQMKNCIHIDQERLFKITRNT